MVSSTRLHDAEGEPDVSGDDPAYDYPRDEFDVDDWSGPVGAHRAARKGWLVALPWLLAVAAVLVITGVALALGLGRGHSDNTAATPGTASSTKAGASTTTSAAAPGSSTSAGSGTSSSSAATAGAVNRQTRIQILNSTRRNGVAHTLQNRMNADGWNVTSVSTYRGGTLPSRVYYRDAKDAATAAAVAKLYGLETKQSSSWSAPVTLMIGPGFPQP